MVCPRILKMMMVEVETLQKNVKLWDKPATGAGFLPNMAGGCNEVMGSPPKSSKNWFQQMGKPRVWGTLLGNLHMKISEDMGCHGGYPDPVVSHHG